MVQFLVDKEILDFSALILVFVTQTDLQMRELEIQKQTELEKLRLEQEQNLLLFILKGNFIHLNPITIYPEAPAKLSGLTYKHIKL